MIKTLYDLVRGWLLQAMVVMCVRGSAKSSVDKCVVKQIFIFKTDLYKG